jgi:hypothetical protein
MISSRQNHQFWPLLSIIVTICTLTVFGGQARSSPGENASFCPHRVKSVSSVVALHFITNKPNYRPGETVVFRIDNVGGRSVKLISEYFSLEQFVNGRWKVSPASPHAFSKIRLGILEPGKSGFCKRFSIPDSLEAGHYRFHKTVVVSLSKKQRRLYAGFHVR